MALLLDSIIDRCLLSFDKSNIISKNNNFDYFQLSQKVYNHIQIIAESPLTINYIYNRIYNIFSYQQNLYILKLQPLLVQRTQPWYNARHTMITASDLAQALGKGKFGSQKDFLIKKINSAHNITINDTSSSMYMPPLIWGSKFEIVATQLYSKRNSGVNINEFGLLHHYNKNDVPYFGASPDGISDLGIMLEIKCPYKRIITGVIPEQYYYQIQGQLEVCNLNECDYLECKFSLYQSLSDFKEDTYFQDNEHYANNIFTKDLSEKGVIISYWTTNYDDIKYLYSPPYSTTQDIEDWILQTLNTFDIHINHKIEYWRLDQYFCKRVYRDNTFNDNKKYIQFLWNKISFYKLPENKNLFIKDILKSRKKTIYDFKTLKIDNEILPLESLDNCIIQEDSD
jgi:putative phage-type endonuclease